ncbi:MAG: excinuclease ABC subunit A [Bacteroidetes bacterium]|nr:excinuclease ABC subunit A [Bacteroidota bacterium]
MDLSPILIKGARMHNLKNVTVAIPRRKLVVITGVSGSGKSSLAIDTLYAEGQRRYAESLNSYARQFLNRMDKPEVDTIIGLSPAIAIEQKVITRTPRSTVGSLTEIYDYLRLLFARVGHTISPVSGQEVRKDDIEDVIAAIKKYQPGDRLYISSALHLKPKRSLRQELNVLQQKGFSRVYLEGHSPEPLQTIDSLLELTDRELKKYHPTHLLVDRIIVKDFDEDDWHRISDSIATAFSEGEGSCALLQNEKHWQLFSNRFERDGLVFEEPVPALFSFNNPFGACPTCEGFSQVLGIDEELVLPNKKLSVYEGAVAPWKGEKMDWWRQQFVKGAKKLDFPIHRAIEELSLQQLNALWKGGEGVFGIDDFFKDVEAHLYKVQFRVLLSRYRGRTTCPNCQGYRLRKEALYVKVLEKHIGECCRMPVHVLLDWVNDTAAKLSAAEQKIATRIFIELRTRLSTLCKVGLGYLTLDRLANTLSGGESQRIQLTRHLGSNLTDSLYILDEPSIGLHPRDTENLITVLKELRELGNTVIVVEHDAMIMQQADHIIDMGPLASHLGGEVVAQGDYHSLLNQSSLTAKYLRGEMVAAMERKPRNWKRCIEIKGARQHNLKQIDVQIPLQVFCAISGVSGSGKTTLVKQILYPALLRHLGDYSLQPGAFSSLGGDLDLITQLEWVDQNPIGKSTRSNPVTYIKAYDAIRDLYANLPLSIMRGMQARHFSFNVDGGRCDTCKGEGEQLIEMQFLADVHLTCESCGGKRFKEEVLEITYKEKSIFQVLEMSVDQAIEFFASEKALVKALLPLQEVGLGYIKLGQSATTLSGGEAQRVKLASFLGNRKASQKILFIFDEPTTGLHFHDVGKLLQSLQALIEQGHSVVVIEHNTTLLNAADWIIDMGPEAGEGGGQIVFAGTPQELKRAKKSFTAQYLNTI